MSTKRKEIADALEGKGPLGKAADDEPIFILRAQDRIAPIVVRMWAEVAAALGCGGDKIIEAENLAEQMEAWQGNKKWPD